MSPDGDLPKSVSDRPVAPETFTFLDRLFGKVATSFPDRHFHVGGDEISGADWKANSRVQEFMKTNGLMTLGELESYFFDRLRKGVVAHGKTRVAVPTSLKEKRTRSVCRAYPLGGAAIPPDPDGRPDRSGRRDGGRRGGGTGSVDGRFPTARN